MKYTVKKGKRDFRPINVPWIRWKTNGFSIDFNLLDGTDVNPPLDLENDWNKLLGVSFSIFKNNKCAVMGAFRYNDELLTKQVCVYVNYDGRHYDIAVCDIIKTGRMVVHFKDNGIQARVETDVEERASFLSDINFKGKTSKQIGMWYGGTYPAPVDTTIECNIKTW